MTSPRPYSLAARVSVLVVLVVFTTLVPLAVFGQPTGSRNPPLMIQSVAGRDLFEFYCATCHGRDAKGTGPAAGALRVPPPDLTTLAARNGGVFPSARVEALVTGDQDMPAAHGSREMPVWGPIFRGLDPNDRLNRVRIRNIVEYLASMQVKLAWVPVFQQRSRGLARDSASARRAQGIVSGIAIASVPP